MAECARGTLYSHRVATRAGGLDGSGGPRDRVPARRPGGRPVTGQLWAPVSDWPGAWQRGIRPRVVNAMTAAGVDIEQFHPEYGVNPFEISLSPRLSGGSRRPSLCWLASRWAALPAGTASASASRRSRSRAASAPAPSAPDSLTRQGQPVVLGRAARMELTPTVRPRSAGSSPDCPSATVLVRFDRLRTEDAAGQLVPRRTAVGDREPGRRCGCSARHPWQPTRRQRRGQDLVDPSANRIWPPRPSS